MQFVIREDFGHLSDSRFSSIVGGKRRQDRAENERMQRQQEVRKRMGDGKLRRNERKAWGMKLEYTDGP